MAMIHIRANEYERAGAIFSEIEKISLTYNNWKICYVYDLNEYYNEINIFQNCIKRMDLICLKLSEKENCKMLTSHLKNEYTKMTNEMQTINPSKKLRKRAAPLPIVGKLTNVLFGIMDEESAQKYDEKINELVLEVNDHNNFLEEQTTIIKKAIVSTSDTLNNFNKKNSEISKDIKLNVDKTNMVIHEIELRENLNFLTEIATLIILDHKDVHESIIKLTRDTASGDLSDLIPISSIRNDLQLIKKDLNNDENFPINVEKDNIHNIFTYTEIKAGEKSDKLLIEITIPLVENKKFALYNVIPIPIVSQNTLFMLKIESKEIVIDTDMTQIIEFGSNDKCMGNEISGRVCAAHMPLF